MELNHGPEILKVLEGVQGPKDVAGLHCKGHGSGELEATEGNNLEAPAAKGPLSGELPVTVNSHATILQTYSSISPGRCKESQYTRL